MTGMRPPKRPLPTILPTPSPSTAGQHHAQEDPQSILARNYPASVKQSPMRAITPLDCRKRKIKCNGTRPRCAPCVDSDLNCEFAAPEGVSPRQTQRQRIETYQSVFDLMRHGTLTESMYALQRITDADQLDEAANSITEARLLLPAQPSNMASATRNDAPGMPPLFGMLRRENRHLMSPYDNSAFMFEKQYVVNARDQYVADDIFVDVSAHDMPLSRWTTVSDDDRHMNHLLTLFFTWDNIVERAFYRPIFEEDVVGMDPQSADDDQGSFCSQFLINALLAVSCASQPFLFHFTRPSIILTYQLYTLNPVTFKDSEDSKSRGRRWADEAEQLLEKINRPSIPLLQGLYSLFVYEGNIGTGTKSVNYFLRSMDVYKDLNDMDMLQQREGVDEARLRRERQAISWCMWGFYCCEWRSSQAFGFRKLAPKPKVTRAWREDNFPLSQPDCVGHWWYPYPISFQLQKSMQVEVREVDVILSELVEDILDFIYPKEGELPPLAKPQRALELYDALVDWKLSCPSHIKFEEAVLPSTILLHIGLEVMFTAILRPFSHMTKEEFGRFSPRERCYAHAGSLMSAIWTFRAFAQVRFEYWLTHALGTAAYIVLRDSKDAPMYIDTLIRACQCLHEMRISLPLATDVLGGIRAPFNRYKLPVPVYMNRYFETVHHRKDGLMHHAVAALLPNSNEVGRIGSGAELQLQELLDEFDNIDID